MRALVAAAAFVVVAVVYGNVVDSYRYRYRYAYRLCMREQPLLLLLLYCIQSSLAASWHGKGRDWPGFGSWHQAPGTASANHIINDYTKHAALQLSRKPLRALPVRRTVRRTLPEGSRA